MIIFKQIIFFIFCISLLYCDTFQLPDLEKKSQSEKKIDKKTEKEIIAIGYGSTEKEALNNAFNSAIESFVGVIVDSKTVMKNFKIIKENILTASNGFIRRYDKIYTKENKGVVEVKIKAIVKSQKVYNTMRDFHIKTISEATISNTKNIYANITTKLKTKNDVEKILKREINDFIGIDSINDMIKVKIVNSKIYDADSLPTYFKKQWYTSEIKENRVPIEIFYKIEFDYSLYEKKIKKLEDVFKNLGAKVQRNYSSIYNHKGYFYLKKFGKLGNTNLGIIRKNKCGYVLDIWKFPSDWKDIFPFGIKYGSSQNKYIKIGKFYNLFTLKGYFQDKKANKFPFFNQNKRTGISLSLKGENGDRRKKDIYVNFLIDDINNGVCNKYSYWYAPAYKGYIKTIHPIWFYSNNKFIENPTLSTLQWVNLDTFPKIDKINMLIEKRKKR